MEWIISIGVTVGTIICNIIITMIQNKKSMALIEYRLAQLEKKVDTHNNVITRTYELEKQMAVIQEDIKNGKSN